MHLLFERNYKGTPQLVLKLKITVISRIRVSTLFHLHEIQHGHPTALNHQLHINRTLLVYQR